MHAFKVLAATLGVVSTFLLAAAGGATLHVGLPAARRLTAEAVSRGLGATFTGRLVIDRIGRVGPNHAEGAHVTVFDSAGRRVLVVDGASGRVDVVRLLRSVFSKRGPLEVAVRDIVVDHAEVILVPEADGVPSLARTFVPRKNGHETGAPSRGTNVGLDNVHIRHAWVHGDAGGSPLDAEVANLAGSARFTPERLAGTIDRVSMRARAPLPREAKADGAGYVNVPSAGRGDATGAATLDGAVGGVRVSAGGVLRGAHVRLTVDVPRVDGASVRDVAPSAPIYAPASAHVDAEGTLPAIRPRLHATLGDATLDLRGDVILPMLAGSGRADVQLDVHAVNVRALEPSGPSSALSASVKATAALHAGALRGSYELTAPEGRLAGERVPEVTGSGSFTRARLDGEVRIEEPGVASSVTFTLHGRGGHAVVDFDAQADAPDLMHIARIPSLASGAANARARGTFDIAAKNVDAQVNAEATRVTRGELGFDRATLDARAQGSVAHMGVGATLTVARGDCTARARIESAHVGSGVVDLPSIGVEGLGQPVHGSARIAAGRARIAAQASDIDVERLARFVGSSLQPLRGHVAVDANVEAQRSGARGEVTLDGRELDVARVRNAEAHVKAKLDGRALSAHAMVVIPGAAALHVDAPNLVLGGAANEPRAWERATGEVAVDGRADLSRVLHLFPADRRPLDDLAGMVDVTGKAERRVAADAPSFEISLVTKGLSAQARTRREKTAAGSTVPQTPAWRTEGVDVRVNAASDAATQGTHVAATLFDAKGTLANASLDAPLPLMALARAPDNARAILAGMPLSVRASMPRRHLADLPRALGRLPIDGDGALDVEARGTADAPNVTATARGWNLRGPRDTVTRPFDAKVDARYDGKKGAVDARVTRGTDALAELHADLSLALRDASLDGAPPPWTADLKASLHAFPLRAIAPVADRHVRGELSGEVELHGLHRDATLAAQLETSGLSVGDVKFTNANVTLKGDGHALDARVRVEQADGFGDVHATAGVAWGASLFPSIDAARQVALAFDARGLRAAALKPLMKGTFNELDGRIDANVRMRTIPQSNQGEASGAIVFSNGVVEIPALGEEFHGAHTRVTMQPWGTLRFDDIGADAGGGHVDAAGTARLEGGRFIRADGQATIDRGKRIPLSLQGVSLGEAWGKIVAHANMSPDRKRLDVALDVPDLHVELPHSTAHPVQSLDPDPHVEVGVRRASDRFTLVPLEAAPSLRSPDALELRFILALSHDVEVRRDTTLQVFVTGKPVIDVDDKTVVSGEIQLLRGKVEVQGKIFKIDHGTVSFTGQDSANPIIVASTYYEAADGTRIFADFTGPLQTGKLSLRSEPPHTRDEILAILVYGSAEGSFGTAPAGADQATAAQATSFGGAFVAQGINKALAGVSSLQLTTRVDTSEANNPRPELEVQLTKDIGVQVAYNLGVPGPGQNPDRTLFMVDWRFVRRWLLETTVGDRGSSWVDLLWNLRY